MTSGRRTGAWWEDPAYGPFERWRGDTTRLDFRCPEHGVFSEDVHSHRISAAPARLTASCPVKIPIEQATPWDMANKFRCNRVSPWTRSHVDDDPGDEAED